MEAALLPVSELLPKIPGSLDVWTEVTNGVRTVEAARFLNKDILIGLFSEVKGDRFRLYTKNVHALSTNANSDWMPMALSSPGWKLPEAEISKIWVARPEDRRQTIFSSRATNFIHQILVLAGRVLYTITVDDTAGYPYKYQAVEHLRLPEHLDESTLEVAWNPDRHIVVVAFGAGSAQNASASNGAPKILPLSEQTISKSQSLYYLNQTMGGWRHLCEVGLTAEYLSLSSYGNRCVWREMLCAEAPEEAERGDFFGADIPAPLLHQTEQGNVTRKGFDQVIVERAIQKIQLTTGAGRVDWARLNADGTAVVLLANFEKTRPITTHRDLFLVEWPAIATSRGTPVDARGQSDVSPPLRLTDPGLREGGSIEDFGWVPLHTESKANALAASDAAAGVFTTSIGTASRSIVSSRARGRNESVHANGMLWTSEIRGSRRAARVLHVQVKFSTQKSPSVHSIRQHDLPSAVVSGFVDSTFQPHPVHANLNKVSLVFATETDILWPHVCVADFHTLPTPLRPGVQVALAQGEGAVTVKLHSLPHNNQRAFDDISVERVNWQSRDGTALEGLLYEQRSSSPSNPLLVHAHGGPAGAFAADRTAGANSTRYPYRHFLKAGYRVFLPLFRGTLGFGDDFAQANIQKQGEVDIADISSGVRYLLASHPRVKCPASDVGIFGGSYGGYLTLRALSKVRADPGQDEPFRFVAGVAEYGFLHNRWMSYEGGDFTWEDEYVGDSRKFPTRPCKADVFDDLASVRAPCLLMHGEDDDICPVSQSRVGYNVLRHTAKVPTGLIVYPGEGHGFALPAHRRDRDRRMLVWFLTYLPVATPSPHAVRPAPKTSVEVVAELEGRELHPHELALKMQSAVADTWGQSLREAFLAVDKNRDGIIDRRELEALLARQNLNQFPAETAALLDSIDRNGDGKLDFSEFSDILSQASQEQSSLSEAQDGFRQPATNFYQREAERLQARRAREDAEAARWSAPRAFAGANTASSVILGGGESEQGPQITGGEHRARKFAGANTASSIAFGDDGARSSAMTSLASEAHSDPRRNVQQTPVRTSAPRQATEASNATSVSHNVQFGTPQKEASPFDPSNFVSSANSVRTRSKLEPHTDAAPQQQFKKRFAGRNASSSITFTGDGLVSEKEQAPGPLSSVRTLGTQRTESHVAIDHGAAADFSRKNATDPAQFLSQVAAIRKSPTHGQRRQHSGRRARSPPRRGDVVESSLETHNGALVSRRETKPRPMRAVSPGRTQESQYEIAERPGKVPYRQIRKSAPSHAAAKCQDVTTFLSHVGKGEHTNLLQKEPVDPARVTVGRSEGVAAGSKYTPSQPQSLEEVMMRHEAVPHQTDRFAGRRQASKVVMNPQDAARLPNTPRSTRRHVGQGTKSSVVFG